MALPETDIGTAMVKNAIGESVNAWGALVRSELVNRWGINSPYPPQQSKYWGNFNPALPNEAGMFRRYDHYWRCFSVNDASIDDDLEIYKLGYVNISLKFFPAWSTIAGTTIHYFDVFMSRSGPSFTNPAFYTQIGDNVPLNNDGTYSLLINPSGPPDNGSLALPENSTFWLKFKHVSSDARRFDKNQFETGANITADPNDENAWIIEVSVGEYPFTNQIFVGQVGGSPAIVSKYAGGNYILFPIHFSNTWEVSQNIGTVYMQINNQSDFNGSIDALVSVDLGGTIPAATYDGTLHYGTLDTAAYKAVSLNNWSIGQTFYGRVSIDGGLTWHTGFNGTVTNTNPQL